MNALLALIRPELKDLKSYSSARKEADAITDGINLDANEFPWPPFGEAQKVCAPNRYPDPQPNALIGRLAALWGVAPERLLLGRGSDEGIDLLIRLFCRAGKDSILICPPTYGMYEVCAAIQGAKIQRVPLDAEGQLDRENVESACTPETKLIFIPSPNAPMGHRMRRDDILALCAGRADKSLIVVDEAYVEFSETPRGLADALDTTPNLVILRTLSKAYALAGERIGAVIGSPFLIESLRKIMAPYPLTQTSIRAALDALSPNGLVQNTALRRLVVAERKRMRVRLADVSGIERVFESEANFLLVKTADAPALMRKLSQYGIRIRDRSALVPGTVRISIGTPEQNDLTLKALGVELPAATRSPRLFSLRRATKETTIAVTVDLDNPSFLDVATGIGFFDHMLEQLSVHGGFGLMLRAKGDLHVDTHHTIEDCALTLGEALNRSLGDKRGIGRYGFTAPMDDALARVSLDLSGRPYFECEGSFNDNIIPHFFRSLATALQAAIHLSVKGDDTHHRTEASFKALGRSLKQALGRDGSLLLPSTKGAL
ncbi:MAG: histidinol-phosphate transaminase [Alphaproteobacteria bacterium]|nr:histidinol-phosphate transaminase [Alphaproteobacteria bacterium]